MENEKTVLPIRSVVIFGGAGFIGSNWAHHLLKTSSARIHIFDNLSRRGVHHNLEWLQKNPLSKDRLQVTIGDIRNAQLVKRAVHSATEIYHFAAQVAVTTSVEDPHFDFDVNLGGTLNILEAARQTGRRPFLLFTSTNKVYGNFCSGRLNGSASRFTCTAQDSISESQPLDFHSPYGCSKGAADQYVRDYARIFNLPTVVFRMSCIAGPRQFGNEDQGWVAHFLYSALQDRPLSIYGDGRQVRDVLYVEDLLQAFERVRKATHKTAGQVYNVGGGLENAVSLLELMGEIERLTGHKIQYDLKPVRPGDQPIYVSDYRKLQQHVGWAPTVSVRQMLMKMNDWWQQNHQLFTAPTGVGRVPVPQFAQIPGVAV
jgi:CDP-paratose 2-epimerase